MEARGSNLPEATQPVMSEASESCFPSQGNIAYSPDKTKAADQRAQAKGKGSSLGNLTGQR